MTPDELCKSTHHIPTARRTPTTERQLDLARMLAEEMRAMGIADARVDGFGYVYGSLPATPGCEKSPAIGWIAHMDTAQGILRRECEAHSA